MADNNLRKREATAAEWTAQNPKLAKNEAGYETDTGKIKIGNGTSSWSALTYMAGSTASNFRGAWALVPPVYSTDFAFATFPNPPFVATVSGGTTPTPNLTTDKPGKTTEAKLGHNSDNYSNQYSRLQFTVPSGLGAANIKFDMRINAHSESYSKVSAVKKNGTTVYSAPAQQDVAWANYTFPAVAGDVFLFEVSSNGNGAWSPRLVEMHITGLQLTGAANTYNVGEHVVYNSKLYYNNVNGNTSTPGTDATWSEVPVGGTGVLLIANGASVPSSTPVGTIIFEKA